MKKTYLTFNQFCIRSLVVLSLLISGISYGQQRLELTNPGFEASTVSEATAAGWFINTGGTSSAEIVDDSYRGNNALAITIEELAGDPWGIESAADAYPVSPNTYYRYKIWAKATVDSAMVSFTVGNPDYQEVGRSNHYFEGTDWQMITFVFNSGENTQLRFPIHYSAPANETLPVTFTVDALSVEELIIQNGSFENATIGESEAAGWGFSDGSGNNGAASFSIVDDAYAGANALQVEVTALADNAYNIEAVYNSIDMKPNTTYQYSIWAKSSVDGGHLDFTVGNPSYSEVGRLGHTFTGTEYQNIVFTFNSGENTQLRFPIHLSNAANTTLPVSFTIDHLEVTEVPEPLFAGGFENATIGESTAEGWGFNDGTNNNGAATITIVDDAYSGSNALAVEVTGLADNSYSIEAVFNTIAVMPNTDYRYTAWIKSSAVGGQVDFTVGTASYSEVGRTSFVAEDTEWHQVSFEFFSGENLELRFPIHFSSSTNETLIPITFTVDDVNIAPVQPANADAVAVTNVTISANGGGALEITENGGSLQLMATVEPEDATINTVTWSLDSVSAIIASINSSGLLSVFDNGTVTVMATANDGSGVADTVEVAVSGQEVNDNELILAWETFGTSQFDTNAGGTHGADANNGWDGQQYWESDDTVQVSLSSMNGSDANGNRINGVINRDRSIRINSYAFGAEQPWQNASGGMAVHLHAPNNLSGSFDTLMYQDINVDGFTDLKVSFGYQKEANRGARVDTLGLIVAARADDGEWMMLDTTQLQSDLVEGVWAHGTLSLGGLEGTEIDILFTITQARMGIDDIQVIGTGSATGVSSISIAGEDGAALEITEDDGTLQLVADVQPTNASDRTVTWSVDDTSIATISETGLLTAVDNGTVTVTATANDESGISETATVMVSGQITYVTGITVTSESEANIISVDNGTLQMVATVTPTNATDATVTWSVAPAAATIDQNGILTAVANGSVIVTATANGAADGAEVKGTFTVALQNQVADITGLGDHLAFNIHPNPASNGIHVTSEQPVNRAEIISMSGQLIKSVKIKDHYLDIMDLEAGVYFVKVYDQQTFVGQLRVIKK